MDLAGNVSNQGIKKYTIHEIMTIQEASERYNTKVETIKNYFKPASVQSKNLNIWIELGIVRKSGGYWLVTPDFMEIVVKSKHR